MLSRTRCVCTTSPALHPSSATQLCQSISFSFFFLSKHDGDIFENVASSFLKNIIHPAHGRAARAALTLLQSICFYITLGRCCKFQVIFAFLNVLRLKIESDLSVFHIVLDQDNG